ncbi:hypothetical protein [Synechococcus sp. UW179A]|nr:hypothetical protein [Synechococcus sp. UW179A]
MNPETRFALSLLNKFVSALRTNATDIFRRKHSRGTQDLSFPEVEELMMD